MADDKKKKTIRISIPAGGMDAISAAFQRAARHGKSTVTTEFDNVIVVFNEKQND